MIQEYEPEPGEGDAQAISDLPSYEHEFLNAKAFLQMASSNTGDNLYDHLTEVLNKILAERPENIIDFFEEYSRKIKERRFKPMTDHLEDIYVPPGRYKLANKMMPLLRPLPPSEPSTVDPEDLEMADMSKNDLLELLYFFEHCGVGLPRSEMFFIMLSMRKLIHTEPVSSIRFWGKIFGTLKDYIVLECELKEEEYIKRNETYQLQQEEQAPPPETPKEMPPSDNEMAVALANIAKQQQMPGEGGGKFPRPLPPAPVIQHEELPEPPPEPAGVGVNKKVYYICNGPGYPWIQLPDMTPKQIRVARQIYKSFTGNLDEAICTYPEFPGTEKEYLRAQIGRISAGTHISPLGYYTFGTGMGGEGDEEDEEAEEGAGGESKTSFNVNPKYEPPQLKDLLDGSMSFWVHHGQYILPQGRTSWWNPNPMPEVGDEEMGEELGEEEEDQGDKQKIERVEPETGPPLLTPLSEDATMEGIPPWSVRSTSNIIENFAIAVVRSNLWPGAYCFSTQGKNFQNVYLGFGLKYLPQNYSLLPLPPVQQEYPPGPEIMEIMDPTGTVYPHTGYSL
nr:unnamed protein product [Callosobruchus analis]